jgi:plastocyanin
MGRREIAACLVVCGAVTSASAEEHQIHMVGSAYIPQTIVARVGDTLLFVNDDAVTHNVFVPTRAFATDLGSQQPGKPARLPLTKPGTFEVECVFHQDMITRVAVKP